MTISTVAVKSSDRNAWRRSRILHIRYMRTSEETVGVIVECRDVNKAMFVYQNLLDSVDEDALVELVIRGSFITIQGLRNQVEESISNYTSVQNLGDRDFEAEMFDEVIQRTEEINNIPPNNVETVLFGVRAAAVAAEGVAESIAHRVFMPAA